MTRALSRSKIRHFMECPRFFWLDVRARLHWPSGPPFSLNVAVDYLLKNECDRYRGATVVPPLGDVAACLAEEEQPDLAPACKYCTYAAKVRGTATPDSSIACCGCSALRRVPARSADRRPGSLPEPVFCHTSIPVADLVPLAGDAKQHR